MRQEELERQRADEEARRREELERNFDMRAELAKLGGKLLEFHTGEERHI